MIQRKNKKNTRGALKNPENGVREDTQSSTVFAREGLKQAPRKMEFVKAGRMIERRNEVYTHGSANAISQPDPVSRGIRSTGFTQSWRAPPGDLRFSNLEEGVLINRRIIAGKNPLSKEFIVAVVIYEYNQKNESISYIKLIEILSEKVNKTTIKRALDTLLDWKIISFEYGKTDKKRETRLYRITPPNEQLIGELWKNYWNITPIEE